MSMSASLWLYIAGVMVLLLLVHYYPLDPRT